MDEFKRANVGFLRFWFEQELERAERQREGSIKWVTENLESIQEREPLAGSSCRTMASHAAELASALTSIKILTDALKALDTAVRLGEENKT